VPQRRSGAMHVATVVSRQTLKSGEVREYVSHLLRRTFRQEGKVKHETLANLSMLPGEALGALRASLAGRTLLDADTALAVARSLPHGDVAAVWAQARALGLPALLGPRGRPRDLALALVVARVVRPASKLATSRWWADSTLGADLGVAGAATDEVYAAMDTLLARQDAIEAELARRHLADGAMALFDLSSSWMEGSRCPLAARGYSRDGKRGPLQIEYGLLTDRAGRPVAVRAFPGNTADPTAFVAAVELVRGTFGLTDVVLVGDRGMITSARIAALRELGGLGWVTALRAPAIAQLAAADGPLQLGLFDQASLAEIAHPDYPGERLIACRNPYLAAERARKREELLAATETALAPLVQAVAAGRLAGADRIGLKVGRVLHRYKMAKHLDVAITDTTLTVARRAGQIDAEAALDGIYIIRTSLPAGTLNAAGVVAAYKDLANVERDFRILKVDDLDLRPIHHRLADRVRAHLLICLLAGYLTWHLRRAWAPLTFTDQAPPARTDPVAPAVRSPAADRKARRGADEEGRTVRGFRELLAHLATLTRNTVRLDQTTLDVLATPTDLQRRAFQLLNSPIPHTLQ
jgi:Transposase DDE domain